MQLEPGQNLLEESTLAETKSPTDLTKLVEHLRKITNGAPIGIKFAATHYLEQELEIFTQCPIDFLRVVGSEAGIHWGPGLLADDLGLPTLPALCRTKAFLKQRNLKKKISLVVEGGLITPGHFLKALALGADAVAIGTIALVALTHTQITRVIPWEPLTSLLYDNGKYKNKLKVDAAAKNLVNFLKSCNEELIAGIKAMGWCSLQDVSPDDLCAMSLDVAQITGVETGFYSSQEQKATPFKR